MINEFWPFTDIDIAWILLQTSPRLRHLSQLLANSQPLLLGEAAPERSQCRSIDQLHVEKALNTVLGPAHNFWHGNAALQLPVGVQLGLQLLPSNEQAIFDN